MVRPFQMLIDQFPEPGFPGQTHDRDQPRGPHEIRIIHGLRVGLNWSGDRATGYDVEPAAALASLTARESS